MIHWLNNQDLFWNEIGDSIWIGVMILSVIAIIIVRRHTGNAGKN